MQEDNTLANSSTKNGEGNVELRNWPRMYVSKRDFMFEPNDHGNEKLRVTSGLAVCSQRETMEEDSLESRRLSLFFGMT